MVKPVAAVTANAANGRPDPTPEGARSGYGLAEKT